MIDLKILWSCCRVIKTFKKNIMICCFENVLITLRVEIERKVSGWSVPCVEVDLCWEWNGHV